MPHNIKNIAQLAPFAIFVAGVDTSLNRIGAACDAAYGLFFDSPELVSLSGSRKFHHSCVYSAGDHDAVYKGIIEALHLVPHGQSVVIVTDVKWIINQFHRAMHRRSNGQKKWENSFEAPILDLIDYHTRYGDCFVEIKDSGDDPSAAFGMEQAYSLAYQALHSPKL